MGQRKGTKPVPRSKVPAGSPTPGTSRRDFLKTAVAATAGVAAASKFPYIKTTFAQAPIVWKMQSGWPTRDFFHESAIELSKKINEMTGGRIRIDLLPSGAVVGAFGIIDAVHSGLLDAGHAVGVYAYSKSPTTSLFGTGPSFGMDAVDLLSWFYYGGGFDMYQDLLQNQLKLNVTAFLMGPMPTQPLGWFRNPVLNPTQLKRTKFRTVGLSAEVFAELGASVVILPGGEIVPALERGVIDAAEFNNPSSDKALGLPDVRKVYMLQSYHQPVESLEVTINKGKWDALSSELKAIVRGAILAESADYHYRAIHRNSQDLEEMERRGIRIFTTPATVLQAQLDAWDKVIAKRSREDANFAKIVGSQKNFARRVVSWKERIYVDNTVAFNRYFKGKK